MFNSRCSRICWAADRYDEWPSTSSVTSTCKSYRKGYANSRSADLIKGTRMVISILTFSTPGTSMAWMPANPWVSRLHQRINNRKKKTSKLFPQWLSNPKSILFCLPLYLARKVTPRIQSSLEYTLTNLPETICSKANVRAC